MSDKRQRAARVRIARALAYAFVAGEWSPAGLRQRGEQAVGAGLPTTLIRLALRLFPTPPLGRQERLAALLARSRALRSALDNLPALRVRRWLYPEPQSAQPLAPFVQVALPKLLTHADVAQLTGLPFDKLDWFCDLRRLQRSTKDQALRHYLYRWSAKRSGSYRLIEAPKPKLKSAQRRILTHILNKVPLHEACHGHRPERSVHSFVAPHVGQHVVVALDLMEFFSSIHEARVRGLFAALGYSDTVAALLAGLCCCPTPHAVLRTRPLPPHPSSRALQQRVEQRMRLRDSHLPQGAPSSPMLANLLACNFDRRLSALSVKLGARYTRYADDLAFSGGKRLVQALPGFLSTVGAIAIEEGFRVRYEKTRVMHAHQRQQLCGVVVNERPNIQRSQVQQLEAILVNCLRHGQAAQNREQHPAFREHLLGRIVWVEQVHPTKGARLRGLLERIVWS